MLFRSVEGDGSFSIVAKPSKGGGTVTYACATTGVIKVTKAGKVTIVKTFDKTCKTLSKQTKDTIKKVSTKVTMSVPATANYKAASTSVTVTVPPPFDGLATIENEPSPSTAEYAALSGTSKRLAFFILKVLLLLPLYLAFFPFLAFLALIVTFHFDLLFLKFINSDILAE